MHHELGLVDGRTAPQVDVWSLLTGGSASIVFGFALDLWRLARHRAGQAGSDVRARWHCDHPCGAVPR
jgi:hypothetical protein